MFTVPGLWGWEAQYAQRQRLLHPHEKPAPLKSSWSAPRAVAACLDRVPTAVPLGDKTVYRGLDSWSPMWRLLTLVQVEFAYRFGSTFFGTCPSTSFPVLCRDPGVVRVPPL